MKTISDLLRITRCYLLLDGLVHQCDYHCVRHGSEL